MVFKVLQSFPIGLKSLAFQIGFAGILCFLLFFFKGHLPSFLLGFLFSQIYMAFFFQIGTLLLEPKKRKQGFFLLVVKWVFLVLVLLGVVLFLHGKSFVIGLSGIISFIACYAFERRDPHRT